MNYILLDNIIFNHENLTDNLVLKNTINPDSSYYCDDDYKNLLDELYAFLSDKRDVSLIVGTFYYNLPCFVELLADKLKSAKIIPLLFFFIEDNNSIIANEEISVNEVYSHFIIKTTCKLSNNILTIVLQNKEDFDFQNKLLDKIQWNRDVAVTANTEKEKAISLEIINKTNQSVTENDDDFDSLNMRYVTGLHVFDREYMVSIFLKDIVEILEQKISNQGKQFIFNALFYLNKIKLPDNWHNLSKTQPTSQTEIRCPDVSFESEVLPNNREFTSKDEFWILAENENFNCSFSRKINDFQKNRQINIPSNLLSNISFNIGKNNLAKIFFKIKKDILNNLNVVLKMDNKIYYNKIIFNYE